MRTEGGNEDRRGQEGDVFATQNTPGAYIKAPQASEPQTLFTSELIQTSLRRVSEARS